MTNLEPKDTSRPARTSTELAADRTAMAATRSFMAWIRTGLSLISFGFTIYKFLMSVQVTGIRDNGPRNVGLFLIGLGTVSIMFGAVEYRETLHVLQQDYEVQFKKYPLVVGFLVAGLGAVLFLIIVLQTM